MSGKSGGSSKRSRQDTNTDVNSLLKDIEKYRNTSLEQEKDIEDLRETLKYTKEDLNKSQTSNEQLQQCVRELIGQQKTFAEVLSNIQKMLQVILANQNKNEHTLESIKDISSKQAEEVKTQLQQQEQQQQQQQQQIKQIQQKQYNERVQIDRKTK